MKKTTSKRRTVKLSAQQIAQLRKDRELVASELPSLMAKQQRLREAAGEQSANGQLRRTIHASKILLHDLANSAGTDLRTLDAFLLGEARLPAKVANRLREILKHAVEYVNGNPLHQEETEWRGDAVSFEGRAISVNGARKRGRTKPKK